LESYRILDYQRLILTKLDETSATGVIGSLAERSTARISYITTGQGVPDDFEPADPRRLAELALGYRTLQSAPGPKGSGIGA
jgi:flagellar biosynthesis protein FlhF